MSGKCATVLDSDLTSRSCSSRVRHDALASNEGFPAKQNPTLRRLQNISLADHFKMALESCDLFGGSLLGPFLPIALGTTLMLSKQALERR